MPLSFNKKISTKDLRFSPEYQKMNAGQKAVWRSYVQGCKRTGRKWLLDVNLFISIISARCTYCGQKRVNAINTGNAAGFSYVGVNRIDNDGDYEIGNVRPCCKICNSMKSQLGDQNFLRHIKKICTYQEL